jgi:hypothetical protein
LHSPVRDILGSGSPVQWFESILGIPGVSSDRMGRMAEPEGLDQRFGEIALRLGFVTRDQLDQAIRIRDRNLELGLEIRLEEIFLKLDHLKAEQADTIHGALSEKSTLQPESRGEKKIEAPPGLAVRGETLLDFQGESEEEPEDTPAPPPPLTASAVEEKDTVMGGPPAGIPDTTIGGPESKKASAEGEEKKKGKWIGPYRIVQEIGRGGMGVGSSVSRGRRRRWPSSAAIRASCPCTTWETRRTSITSPWHSWRGNPSPS